MFEWIPGFCVNAAYERGRHVNKTSKTSQSNRRAGIKFSDLQPGPAQNS